MVDPPSGYLYKFPKVFTWKEDGTETLTEWFLRHGYPQALIDQGMLKWVRYYEVPLEDKYYLE